MKFFVRKYIRDYRTAAILNLSVRYRNLCDEMKQHDEDILGYLFGSLPTKWVGETDLELRELALSLSKAETWGALDHSRLYSDSVRRICEAAEANFSIAEGLRFLEKANTGSGELKPDETFMHIYGRIIGRGVRTYLEQIYNLFVEEFPVEQHAQLHDVYLRATFRLTQSGTASKLVAITSSAKKSFKFSLTGNKKTKEPEKPIEDVLSQPENWDIKIWAPKVPSPSSLSFSLPPDTPLPSLPYLPSGRPLLQEEQGLP